jgi:hypothetical protein
MVSFEVVKDESGNPIFEIYVNENKETGLRISEPDLIDLLTSCQYIRVIDSHENNKLLAGYVRQDRWQ